MHVLFIGNSHTYYNSMPAIFADLFAATGEKVRVTMLAEGGKTLAYHMKTPNTVFNLRYGKYDVVILQDLVTGFDEANFYEGARTLTEMAQKAGTKILFYLPFDDDPTRQQKLTRTYTAFARERGIPVAPAGEAFAHLRKKVPAPTLYREDGRHATPYGSYIVALTLFYTLTGRRRALSPEKIKDPGIALGFSVAECRTAHEEALLAARLFADG